VQPPEATFRMNRKEAGGSSVVHHLFGALFLVVLASELAVGVRVDDELPDLTALDAQNVAAKLALGAVSSVPASITGSVDQAADARVSASTEKGARDVASAESSGQNEVKEAKDKSDAKIAKAEADDASKVRVAETEEKAASAEEQKAHAALSLAEAKMKAVTVETKENLDKAKKAVALKLKEDKDVADRRIVDAEDQKKVASDELRKAEEDAATSADADQHKQRLALSKAETAAAGKINEATNLADTKLAEGERDKAIAKSKAAAAATLAPGKLQKVQQACHERVDQACAEQNRVIRLQSETSNNHIRDVKVQAEDLVANTGKSAAEAARADQAAKDAADDATRSSAQASADKKAAESSLADIAAVEEQMRVAASNDDKPPQAIKTIEGIKASEDAAASAPKASLMDADPIQAALALAQELKKEPVSEAAQQVKKQQQH